jgi:hypothetical protein
MSCEKLFEALILLGMLPLVPLRCGEGILETINLILQRLDVELFSFPMRSENIVVSSEEGETTLEVKPPCEITTTRKSIKGRGKRRL